MQIFSQYLQTFGVLFLTLMCTPQNIFAISPQSPNPLLTSKEHKKKFALRGTRGKPGRQGNSGSGSGATGATGPQGPQGPTGPTGAESASLAGINGYASKSNLLLFNPGATIVQFNTTSITDGVSYNGTNTFTINTAGQYRIYYMINPSSTSPVNTTADSIQTIIQINGISQPATNVRITAPPVPYNVFTMYEGIFALNVNDQINVLLTTTKQILMGSTTNSATFGISKLD